MWKEAFELMLEEWRAADTAAMYFRENGTPQRIIRTVRETGEALYKSKLVEERVAQMIEEEEWVG